MGVLEPNALTVLSDGRVYFSKTTEEVNNTVVEYDPFLYDGIKITEDSKSLQRILSESEQKLVEISHAELLERLESANLIPGQFYRIIDYVTTVKREYFNISSANNPFDIIVLALSKDTLSENAYAIHKNSNAFGTNIDYYIKDINSSEIIKLTDTNPLYVYTYNTDKNTFNKENNTEIIIKNIEESNISGKNLIIKTSSEEYSINNKYNNLITLTDTNDKRYIYNYLALENVLTDDTLISSTSSIKANKYLLNSFLTCSSNIEQGDTILTKVNYAQNSGKGYFLYKINLVNDDNDSEIVAYMLYIADNQFMANFLSKNINSLTTNSLWNAIYNNAFAVYVNKSEIFDKTVLSCSLEYSFIFSTKSL